MELRVLLAGDTRIGAAGGLAVVKEWVSDQGLGPFVPLVFTRQNRVLLAGRLMVGTKLFVVGIPEFNMVENVEPTEIWMLYPLAPGTGSQVKVGREERT